MTYTPHLIANFSGLNKEVETWLLPADAFSEVKNAYLKRGVINKRKGYTIFKRFASARGLINAITQSNPAVVAVVNHGLVTGDQVFITGVVGMTEVNNRLYTITVTSIHTFSLDGVNSSAYTPYVSGGIAWFFQDEPIMGLQNFIKPDGSKQLCIFNTRRMAVYDSSAPFGYVFGIGGIYDAPSNRFPDYFTGNNTNFFWTENYRSSTTVTNNKLYITNNVDNIYTWDGTTLSAFLPQYGANPTDIVNRCLFIFAFKQRLVLLSTQENGSIRPQRARWCQAQNPQIWDEVTPGRGGFVDAPTGEFIIGAAFLKDVLIVQFTNSWWTLRPTSDPALPFRWDRITSNRPVNAPFASLSYDNSVTGIGQGGIVECNGVGVNRIDSKIPEFVNDINQSNFLKVYASRYLQEYQTWTLYPSQESSTSDEVLVLNEEEGSWSQYNLALSTLGFVNNTIEPKWEYYQAFAGDPSANLPPLVWVASLNSGLEDFGSARWLTGYFQLGYPLFLGGSHDGYIYQLETGSDDNGEPISMELLTGQWNPYKEQGIGAQLGYIDFLVDSDPVSEIVVEFFVNNETGPYIIQQLNFIPQPNFVGDVGYITNTNPAIVGVYEHNLNTGDVIQFYRVQGMISLNGGSYTVTVIDDDSFSVNNLDAGALPAYTGNGIVVKGDFEGLKVWKRIFSGSIGFAHRLKITNQQNDQPVRIHAIMPWFRPAGERMITL